MSYRNPSRGYASPRPIAALIAAALRVLRRPAAPPVSNDVAAEDRAKRRRRKPEPVSYAHLRFGISSPATTAEPGPFAHLRVPRSRYDASRLG